MAPKNADLRNGWTLSELDSEAGCNVGREYPRSILTNCESNSTHISVPHDDGYGRCSPAQRRNTPRVCHSGTYRRALNDSVDGFGTVRCDRPPGDSKRRNVILTLLFTALNTLYLSTAQGPIFDIYLYIVGNGSNRWVGDAESISGLTALIVAAPIGIIVDRFNRALVCKIICVLGVTMSVVSCYACYYDVIPLVFSALFFWGIFWEGSSSATSAIFTDSLDRSDRTKWFTRRGVLRSFSWSIGPLIMTLFFRLYGDHWDITLLHSVILGGTMLFAPVSSCLLWFFQDVEQDRECGSPISREIKVMNNEENSGSGDTVCIAETSKEADCGTRLTAQSDNDETSRALVTKESTSTTRLLGTTGIQQVSDAILGRNAFPVHSSASYSHDTLASQTICHPHVDVDSIGDVDLNLEANFHVPCITERVNDAKALMGRGTVAESEAPQLSNLTTVQRAVPFIVCVADVVRAVGAGMTVKFFPLFFKNEYSFTPMQLCALSVVYAICVGSCMFVAERLALRWGRASASQLLAFLGLVALVLMCHIDDIYFLVVAHLLRGACQNASYPVDRSILMDFTKSKDRGKWSAVESVTSTVWSGSAFIGGIMADSDYRFAFGVTAMIYAVAWVVYLPLVFIVPKAEKILDPRTHPMQNCSSSPSAESSAAAATQRVSSGTSRSLQPDVSTDESFDESNWNSQAHSISTSRSTSTSLLKQGMPSVPLNVTGWPDDAYPSTLEYDASRTFQQSRIE